MTEAQAMALLRRAKVVCLTSAGEVPSLVEAVVGAPVRGSWWGHPCGKVIYDLASALEDRGDVLVTRLVRGKVTFIHRALWPALARIVTDESWRRGERARLNAGARRLCDEVERSPVRLDEWISSRAGDAAARRRAKEDAKDLQETLLVLSHSVHTDRGNHVTVLRDSRRWAGGEIGTTSLPDLEDALRAVRDACRGEPTTLDGPTSASTRRRAR